jgi:hypothetical protein
MAKLLLIAVISGCIDYKGETHVVGGPAFECEAKEAKRLIELGVAEIPDTAEKTTAATGAGMPTEATFELLAAIEAATTIDELTALMPEEQPVQEIITAFEAKMAELAA